MEKQEIFTEFYCRIPFQHSHFG